MLERFLKPRKSEPTDLEISYRGQQVWKTFSRSPITTDEILRIQSLHGYDIASWVLFQYFKEKESFKSFSHFIEAQRESYSKLNNEYLVVVLCHNPWETKSKNIEYQWRMKNIVADAGFEYSYPEVSYRSTVYESANYYRDIIDRFSHRKLIFLTYGQSTLELRLLLEKKLINEEQIVGWISVSGLMHGTALAPANDDKLMAVKRYMNSEFPVSPDVGRSAPYALHPVNNQYGFPIISMLGFCPTKAMSSAEEARAGELMHWGPHDTYSSHVDFLKDDHLIWPIWGDGHFITLENYKKRLQAACKWLILQNM
jgi:hypothetical protein